MLTFKQSSHFSLLQIHSITARSVPKGQLEKLKNTANDDPRSRVAVPSSEPVNPGRATSLTTGQQIKVTPSMPKQVYQSSDVQPSTRMQQPKQSIQVSSNVKKSDSNTAAKSHNVVKISLAAGNTNRPISPELSETKQPIKSTVTNTSHSSSQSGAGKQDIKTGNEIDTPEGRKSPKIRSGAISAMSKFWEKRMTEGTADEEAPEILENA